MSHLSKKKSVAEQVWLHYYNQTLFEKGLITERARNKMKHKINARVSSERER